VLSKNAGELRLLGACRTAAKAGRRYGRERLKRTVCGRLSRAFAEFHERQVEISFDPARCDATLRARGLNFAETALFSLLPSC
jgi:hypothetical protein